MPFELVRFIKALWPPIILTLLSASLVSIAPGYWKVIPVILTVIMVIDIYGRGKCYLRLYSKPHVAYNTKIWDYYGTSFCGRNVIKSVCIYDVKEYYYKKGYRWYHLFPDGTFTKRMTLFRLSFWKSIADI